MWLKLEEYSKCTSNWNFNSVFLYPNVWPNMKGHIDGIDHKNMIVLSMCVNTSLLGVQPIKLLESWVLSHGSISCKTNLPVIQEVPTLHLTHPSLVVFLCLTRPSICHQNYFQPSKGHVIWIMLKVNIIPMHCGVAYHMRIQEYKNTWIQLWFIWQKGAYIYVSTSIV